MTATPGIAAARARRDAAKAQLMTTLDETKERLSPSTIAGNAVDGIKEKASTLASDGVAVARERPTLVALAAGAAGLLLVRRPIFEWFTRHRHRETSDTEVSLQSGASTPSDEEHSDE